MCGIVGIFDRTGQRPVDRGLLRRMNDTQEHRGPDDSGLLISPGVGLGHRRLSIIDLAGGHQPLFNEDRSVAVVFNGEIFNFIDLAEELRSRGHQFRTSCDTEVIVHGWEEWGEACVERFRGQFAFAIWDQNSKVLFLARDRLGIKPLHYADLPDGTFVFGSELKSVLEHPGVERNIDPQAVEDYFGYGYVPDPKTIFSSVRKLPPGHTLCRRRGGPAAEPRQYWNVRFDRQGGRDLAAAGGELVERLREAVKIRLIADVPLGAFLSGGVDSSAVVAMMAGASAEPVMTCSIGFGQADYDESRYAAQVAERYGTNHFVRRVDPEAFDLVDKLADMYDEPFADSSAIPTYRVCALARERVKVALSGDGGDEVFAGYRRYRWHHYEEMVRRCLPAGIRSPLFGMAGRTYPKLDWAPRWLRAKSTFQALARESTEGYFHSVSFLTNGMRDQLFSPTMRRDLQGYRAIDVLLGHLLDAPAEDHLSRVQYADMKTYLPGDILTKVDRASMANSLEVRVPFLDHHLVEWSAKLPSQMLLQGREGKYVLKNALQPYLSQDILYRNKMGFAVPLADWFRGPLRTRVKSAVTGPILADSGIFDMRYIGTLVSEHQSRRRDHSSALWALIMFESFLRKAHAGGEIARPESAAAEACFA